MNVIVMNANKACEIAINRVTQMKLLVSKKELVLGKTDLFFLNRVEEMFSRENAIDYNSILETNRLFHNNVVLANKIKSLEC